MSEDYLRNSDTEPERGKDKLSALYHASPRVEPPEHLDEAILAASRRAVKTRLRAMVPFSGRWHIPASMAAVLIIAVVLVPLLKHASQTPNGDNVPMREQDTSEKLMSEPVPHSSPSTLDEAEPFGSPKPAPQAPMPRIAPGRLKTRGYSKELRSSPAESSSQDSGAETSLQKQIAHPDQWLVRIRRLKQAGQTQQAKEQLRRFLARHPDYPLEPSLHELLKDAGSEQKPDEPN